MREVDLRRPGHGRSRLINVAADWYRDFLPPDELHSPEMDEPTWEAEARRMTWWGAFSFG